MKKISLKSTALLLISLFSVSAFAEDSSVKKALEKMTYAVNNLNYEIAFVQTSPNNMDSFRYRHIKRDNKTYAQLVTLDGEQQEIIQRDNLVSYFQPNSQAFTLNSGSIVDALPAIIRSQDLFDGEIIDSSLFSDGLFTFTLYVTKAESQQPNQDKTWKQGEFTLYSEVIGDKEITFIGQLPITTAKRIVQEVKFTNH